MKAIERTQEEMRHVKTALGLVVAVCLLGVMTAPALAHEFNASKYKHTIAGEEFKTAAKIVPETLMSFVFTKYKIKCGAAYGKGLITAPVSTEMDTHLIFGKCGYYPTTGPEHIPASIKGGVGLGLKVNGAAELEGNESGEELEYGTKAELRETAATFAIPAGKYCTVIVPQQVVPAKAVVHPEEEFVGFVKYSNDPVTLVEPTATQLKLFPGGVQHKIIVSLTLKQIKWKFAEGTQCFEDEKAVEGQGGLISGELVQEVVGGNLEFH